ncbi:MAG TPA: AtpZ/AtpI family protein [Smithella sp.]|nr:AtpZ/AtpI family protein [Smithella sp.]
MSTVVPKTRRLSSNLFRVIIALSAWGLALVITSLFFLWLGHLLDEWLGTTPKFMLGFLLFAVAGCFFEIYHEALKVMRLRQ